MQQSSNHIFVGLQQDTSVSKQAPEYLIDAHNIRLTAREGETLLSVTNEKGPKELVIKNNDGNRNAYIQGTILGHCVLNDYLVLFTHDDTYGDSILRIDMANDPPTMVNMFQSPGRQSLGFDVNYPIEAIGDYENEHIQKVYWTDGINQPRVINIMHSPYSWAGAFDFVPELQLNETVEVTRVASSGGTFPSGTIQYAFTYYNKYGQESNIFYTTPLYYTSFHDRGGSPESSVSNAFKIKVSGIDNHFDYLRIYSIQRTSIDAVPTCKRIQDIAIDGISGSTATYTDTGTNGDIIDPTALLFIGGEEVVAQSMCAKDGTLFLGNIEIKRQAISSIKNFTYNIKNSKSSVTKSTKSVDLANASYASNGYSYASGLSTQSAGFKNREYYRLGIQAQYKNGKWSEPVWIGDCQMSYDSTDYPSQSHTYSKTTLTKLVFEYALSSERKNELKAAGYRKVRPVVVFPDIQDRTILCQGVVSPTVYTNESRNTDRALYAQSSWFFRPFISGVYDTSTYASSSTAYSTTVCSPYSANDSIPYTSNSLSWDPSYIRGVEIQGQYDDANKFRVDWGFLTLHSPDIEFDTSLWNADLSNIKCRRVGLASIKYTASDMDVQTSTPTISNGGSGFVHKSFTSYDSKGIISGLFYDDFVVDDYDNGNKFRAYDKQHSSYKWMIYLWHRNGSINNDVNRPANGGNRSAVLSRKTISNLRYANTVWQSPSEIPLSSGDIPQIFSSNEVTVVKVGGNIYEGNIDTMLTPSKGDGDYFAFINTNDFGASDKDIPITSTNWWKTWSEQEDATDQQGLYRRYLSGNVTTFYRVTKDIADFTVALAIKKEPVRMKYKSTPHIAIKVSSSIINLATESVNHVLPIVELYRAYNEDTMFGGTTQDALKANMWVPAGEPIPVTSSDALVFEYGDTWFSRYDCLKTYPFTAEDPNKLVEIGSFMLETRVNIDGRYDRNRGQVNNTNMSPTNFNLLNLVYSQKDNFFNYRILDDSYYKLSNFPNQITWSTEKLQGSNIDPWTTVTLASTHDMDGSKGKIRSLDVWGDSIYCFQDSGICNILFNSRVQVQASDGVPIEISNSYKVDGKRYISDGIGCINKYSICSTPNALYFIDSIGGHLQAINSNGLSDISHQRNMITWLSKQRTAEWKPNDYTTRLFYDKNNNDVYITTDKESLCYSEVLGQFTSFMSYSDIPVMFNVVDKFYCIKDNYLNEMFAGDYNYFFGDYQGYDITFVNNGKTGSGDFSTVDKIYTNIDFRADKWSDELDSILSSESPFDYVRVWNEYQDTGEVLLRNKGDLPSNLKKKFRVWRVQIPRDAHNRRARMRNTWCKIKLGAAPRYNNGNNGFIQLHDVGVQFYI